MSQKKTKPPVRSEKGDDSIRNSTSSNSPATRALRFLLGKEPTAGQPERVDKIEVAANSPSEITKIDLPISTEIDPVIKIEDHSSSVRAGSQSGSSESQLTNNFPTPAQPPQSNLLESQLNLSQLSSSQPEQFPAAIPVNPINNAVKTWAQEIKDRQNSPETLPANTALNLNWRAIEHTRIPQLVFDEILPQLPPMAQMPYLHLLRLTLGFQRASCHISLESWAARCNQSLASIKRQAQVLQQRGLLKKEHVIFGGAMRGSYYRPIIPGILNDGQNNSSYKTNDKTKLSKSRLSESQLNSGQPRESYMKIDHEDHENKKDHHGNEVMIYYQELTGNQITRADQIAYGKIAYLGDEVILAQMKQIYERSADPIGSFAYFTKAVQKAMTAYHQSRASQKRSLERIIERIRQNRVGSRASLSDLIEEIKRACARDNVLYNNDLVNEILGL